MDDVGKRIIVRGVPSRLQRWVKKTHCTSGLMMPREIAIFYTKSCITRKNTKGYNVRKSVHKILVYFVGVGGILSFELLFKSRESLTRKEEVR
ncbi:hypothetical protein POVCU2_0026240 [Plasmodium ovale curtisi]|uniref:Uncharacterized protein n=1 Tax=Plasmodium ovale curtisi TaxID=864141 RepID=A0A1A8WIK8_PLAOA|nr:hypothetical protein POVCU2_0026240 [Plasmodium ovale curtisi]SBS92760.1 hypothetical protein POVCU1_023970 [Plasmodium ovale curtisi]